MEPWIQTASGGQFWYDDPKPEQVHLKDIAHALSNVCRYTGHCPIFYSVAQHSVLVSYFLMERGASKEILRTALLHDAAEAYINDLAAPLKTLLPDYREIEVRVERVIAEKFGTIYPFPPEIKKADLSIGVAEALQMMGATDRWDLPEVEEFKEKIIVAGPIRAEDLFLGWAKTVGIPE